MARLPIIPEYQARANELTTIHPLTIQTSQNTNFLSPWASDFARVRRVGREQDHVRVPFNPVSSMISSDNAQAVRVSNEQILTTVLSGIRQSGSMVRTARVNGLGRLGAIDCSAVPSSTWTGAQADAMMAFVLATAGTPDYAALVDSVQEINCYAQFIMPMMNSLTPNELDGALPVFNALVKEGAMSNIAGTQSQPIALAYIAAMQKAHGLTAKRAVELYKCGVELTKSGAWSKYTEIWSQTSCAQSWYENPLYLGVGAAALIGAVWFATRKKRS